MDKTDERHDPMAADIMIMILIFDIFLRDSLIGRKRVAIITERTCTKVRSPREVREYVPTYAPTAALSVFIDFPKQSVELPSEWTQTSD